MDAAVALNWTEMRRPQTARVKVDDQIRAVQLARENMQLLEENERLRQENADLAGSAEMWIRLYEAALARANQPSPVFSGFDVFCKKQ
jgi:lysyl-tRNA synthetase class I